MAKSNDKNKLSYLQMPLPSGRNCYKMEKRSWNGLNYKQTVDTGALSMEKNISTAEEPYLVPSPKYKVFKKGYEHPIDVFGFDDFLIVIYRRTVNLWIDYITYNEFGEKSQIYTGCLQAGGATKKDEFHRSIVQFNKYEESGDIINGSYKKKLLIFPDKKSMDFEITESGFEINDMSVTVKEYSNDKGEVDAGGATVYPPSEDASHDYYYRNTAHIAGTNYGTDIYHWCEFDTVDENGKKDGGTAFGWRVSVPPTVPNIKYAAVHLSRVFGVSDDSVYASGFNDYANWNLDTAGEYNESNAWCSKAQSNTKADGDFTGITNYQGHIVCFKSDYMHEIYNTKNPFRIQDIYAEGAIDDRSIQEVNGKLIFVSRDNVKIYTGSKPRIISYYLNFPEYNEAISGTDGRFYYLYCRDDYGTKKMFVYDTISEQWAERELDFKVLNFAHNRHGMYLLAADGIVYKMDTDDYSHAWSFETDLVTNKTVDIKHIKKIQMFADIAEYASIKVYVLYDDEVFDENKSHLVYQNGGYGQKAIRIKPRNTASYGIKLHVEGYGYIRLYELELFMENGGDLYV